MRCPLACVLAVAVALTARGCGREQAPDASAFGAIRGDTEGLGFPVAHAGVGNARVGGGASWLVVRLSDRVAYCDEILEGDSLLRGRVLSFFFHDGVEGTYSVVENDPVANEPGSLSVQVFRAEEQNGLLPPSRRAISGEVSVESLRPSSSEPSSSGAVVEATFSLTFYEENVVPLGCGSVCDAHTGECAPTTCGCLSPDGTTFDCTPLDPARSCCVPPGGETQTVTGWFRATYCPALDSVVQ
jgi:hypothetical protein